MRGFLHSLLAQVMMISKGLIQDKPHQLYQKAFFHDWQARLRIFFASAILSLLLTSNVHTNQASAVFRTSYDVSM
ncbi:hypothetical protein NC653_022997 [Populus alba x Populus x berolinensis]|uniref:Uncharacterized protein n=1 Tax=Populus alba x Populus x berolinensis TaxID=444605 RepID=A0AAD6QAC2_9ROSI|nr:hypothetical protein NC653_022997 [Populus alba x Populus x berolinensis]